MPPLLTSKKVKDSHPLTININLFNQININQMFDKIQMILMIKKSISNNCICRDWIKQRLNCLEKWKSKINLFNQININQMFDKIQMILMIKKSISNNCICRDWIKQRLNCLEKWKSKKVLWYSLFKFP